jgi:molybdate transport system substrate-binding protein
VVGAGNPLEIAGLADLTGDVVLSLCQVEVPCGAYAAAAFAAAGLPVPAAGEEANVKAVLTRVQLGEADAGLVYVTDVLAADGVEGIDLAGPQQVPATYPAVALADAPNPDAAAAFVAFLTSTEAQAILSTHGFGRP